MTCQEFIANLQGMNDGKDFPKGLLKVRNDLQNMGFIFSERWFKTECAACIFWILTVKHNKWWAPFSSQNIYYIYTVFILLFSLLPSLDCDWDSGQHGEVRLNSSRASSRAVCLVSSYSHAVPECCLLIKADRSSQLVLTIEYLRANLELCVSGRRLCFFIKGALGFSHWSRRMWVLGVCRYKFLILFQKQSSFQ